MLPNGGGKPARIRPSMHAVRACPFLHGHDIPADHAEEAGPASGKSEIIHCLPSGRNQMNILKRHILFSLAMAAFSGSVAAQDFGQIRDTLGGAAGMPSLPGSQEGGALGAAGSLGSLGSLESIQPGSLGNAAGILGYCARNNYVGSGDAIPVRDQLMGKLAASSGQPAESNPDYVNGTNGILSSSSGQTLDLSTAGLKAAAAKHLCGKILDQAKSMF
jgi:hypothetical protein